MSYIRSAIGRINKSIAESGYRWTLSLLLDRLGFPALRFWPEKACRLDLLDNQVSVILRAWGMDEEHIRISTGHILYSDLHGIDSHGISMLLSYHRQLRSGTIVINPRIQVVKESASTALIDGGGGLGHVPAETAMRLALAKCREYGLGAVAVRNSGHFGAAGSYASIAADSGLIGAAMTSVRQPALVPPLGLSAMLGTNPLAFAAPAARNRPFLLDMATTVVPVGKIMSAWRRGRPIPRGWAVNDRGRYLTNPLKAFAYRRLTPLGDTIEHGGHKGYGLAVMVETLCSVLSGEYRNEGGVAHFFMALDPKLFRDPGSFEIDMDAMMDSLRSSRPKNPEEPVMVAGDPEYSNARQRRESGVPLSRAVIEDLRFVCRETGVPFMLDQSRKG